MVARVRTLAFEAIETAPVDVQLVVGPGKVGMQIVGLPDKAGGPSMPSNKVVAKPAHRVDDEPFERRDADVLPMTGNALALYQPRQGLAHCFSGIAVS